MFCLVQYIEDNVYNVCKTSTLRKKATYIEAKWRDNRYYPAKVITCHDNFSLLQSIATHNLKGKIPHVSLNQVPITYNGNNIGSSSGQNEVESQSFMEIEVIDNVEKDVDIDHVHNNSNLNVFNPLHEESQTDTISNDSPLIKIDQVPLPADKAPIISNEELFVAEIEDQTSVCYGDHNYANCSIPLDFVMESTVPFSQDQLSSDTDICIEDISFQSDVLTDHATNPERFGEVSLDMNDYVSVQDDIDEPSSVLDNTPCTSRVVQHERSSYTYFDRSKVDLPPYECHSDDYVPDILVEGTAITQKINRKYFCIYCNRTYTKFPQHLMVSHKKEPAVKAFMELPTGSLERRRLIETIRRQGDYIQNTDPYFNTGSFYVARRPNGAHRSSEHYLPCGFCKAFFYRDTLRVHFKKCAGNRDFKQRAVIIGRTIARQVHAKACYNLRTRIFPVLRLDPCVKIIRYDNLTILLANHWCSLYADPHYDDMIRARIRLIGRLIMAAKSIDNSVTDFSSLITPVKYDLVIASINKVAGLNEGCAVYRAPTTATMLVTICKKAAEIWQIECIKSQNQVGKKNALDFLSLFKCCASGGIQRTALENRLVQQRHKVVTLPSTDDIMKLVAYLRIERRKYMQELHSTTDNVLFATWKDLASVTLISLMVFNRRRAGELERISLDDYSRLQSVDSTSSRASLSKKELELAERYKRFEIRGKLNRGVPVLVNWELQCCLDAIIRLRREVGVLPSNPYVFGLPPSDSRHRYLRACVLLREYANLCGAAQPNLLRGTQLRKQLATQCSIQDLSENVVRDVAHFMGHDKSIHDNIYRLPVHTRDIMQMSKVLEMAQGDTNSNSSSDEDDDSQDTLKNIDSQDTLKNIDSAGTVTFDFVTTPTEAEIGIHTPNIQDNSKVTSSLTDFGKRSRKKGLTRICGMKVPWSELEKTKALEQFSKHIEDETLPSLNELSVAIANIPELQNRSPSCVKSWLESEIARHRCSSSVHERKQTTRTRWTSEMKRALFQHFENHLNNHTLPSNRECKEFINLNSAFHKYTVASVKTAVYNERNRRDKC